MSKDKKVKASQGINALMDSNLKEQYERALNGQATEEEVNKLAQQAVKRYQSLTSEQKQEEADLLAKKNIETQKMKEVDRFLDSINDSSKTLVARIEAGIQAIAMDMTLEQRIIPTALDDSVIDYFRENSLDINLIKPYVLKENGFSLKILLTLLAEDHEGAYNLAIELMDKNKTPMSVKQKINAVGEAMAIIQDEAIKAGIISAIVPTTPVKKKVSQSDDVTDNETDSNRSTPPNDGKVHHKAGCTIMCVTDIVYDNPALNQINKNGLFSSLNINPNFDSYNFDPKAAIRAEHELNRHLPQVDEASLLNFDSIFPNVASANADALPDQAYSILESFGLSPLGAISLVAAALVAFQS